MNRTDLVYQIATRVFPLIVLPLATIGNSLCFLVFCRTKFQKRLTRTSSIIIRLLCVNDSILLYLFVIDVLLKSFFGISVRIYWTPFTCRFYKWIRYSLSDFSAYLQLGLSTDRFICCVHHNYYSRWRKRNYLYYLLLIAFALILSKNGSFFSPSYGYVPTDIENQSIIRCAVERNAVGFMYYMAYGQSLIDLIFITCLPFFLILYFNSQILREVLRLRNGFWTTFTRLMTLSPKNSETSISTSNSTPTVYYSSTTSNPIITGPRARHRRLHLTFALGCISFAFIFGTAPYKIFKIIERHDKVVREQRLGGTSKTIGIQMAEAIIDCFVFLSCSTPFFVCFATSSMFREELRRMFWWELPNPSFTVKCNRRKMVETILISAIIDQCWLKVNRHYLEETKTNIDGTIEWTTSIFLTLFSSWWRSIWSPDLAWRKQQRMTSPGSESCLEFSWNQSEKTDSVLVISERMKVRQSGTIDMITWLV